MSADSLSAPAQEQKEVFRHIAWRLMPFLFACLVFNWLDRVSISFAHLQFRKDLGITDTVFGLSVGLFSAGYLLCEIPSNLVLERFGARRTLARIMIIWGFVTIGMAFVQGPYSLYVTRTLLGMAEAGFFPGVILYLTYWFPDAYRARITSRFIMAIAVCGIVGGPVSTWIMTHLAGVGGWHGWQWLFVLDGLPPVMAGLVAYRWLSDRPADAAWLSLEQREIVRQALGQQTGQGEVSEKRPLRDAFRNRTLWFLSLSYCLTIMCTGNVVNFWVPSILRASGVHDLQRLGNLSALPHIIGIVAMLMACQSSDRNHERRWHFAAGGGLAVVGMLLLPWSLHHVVLTMLLLTLMVCGYLIATAIFWSIPASLLPRQDRALGLAFINCCGQISSMLTPVMIGFLRSRLGGFEAALTVVSVLVALGVLILLRCTTPASVTRSSSILEPSS
ncbi:MFS transporter [Gluconobacter sp. Dm-62]|uniref:MFS transporter n=1 Tax=Gluconobacter sp. Dm-62 TaxID=2799804 RepID=UPI001B8BAED9|nr:MFS transporter [Gluconobacter sp. Dm-62]MBS1103499.1 MFS transporter [Gluconobacter sp. Dm-62]